MIRLKKYVVNAVTTLLVILNIPSLEAAACPIGFVLAGKYCYSLKKSSERFSETFVDCDGNLYTSKLYKELSLPLRPDHTLWTEFKSLYPGGPYVDIMSPTGAQLETTYEVNISSDVNINEELCVIIDPTYNFTASPCDKQHYRYCIVNSYDNCKDDPDDDDCRCGPGEDGIRFSGPVSSCLFQLGTSSPVRVNRSQAQTRCRANEGHLLGRGWKNSNYFNMSYEKPLNIIAESENDLYYDDKNLTKIPMSHWHFINNTSGAKLNDTFDIDEYGYWKPAGRHTTYINPICEILIPLKHVNLTVFVKSSGEVKLVVTYLETVDDGDKLTNDHIKCFTDGAQYFPSTVSLSKNGAGTGSSDSTEFILSAKFSGYYWCKHFRFDYYFMAESNKALYIKVKEGTVNTYAVKIRAPKYSLANISKTMEKVWIKKLEVYMQYFNHMTRGMNVDEIESYNETTVLNYRHDATREGLRLEDLEKIIRNQTLKRLYLDASTVLLHVVLFPNNRPVKPGRWESIFIEYMKPVYYCNYTDLSLGMAKTGPACKVFKCVGDYNNGVDTVIEKQEGCYLPATATTATTVSDEVKSNTKTNRQLYRDRSRHGSDSSEEETTLAETISEVTTVSNEVITATSSTRPKPTTSRPTTSTAPPATTDSPSIPIRPPAEEQLAQVIKNLEEILNNTETIVLDDFDNAFTEVNDILGIENIEIPGNLLHLLDDIGGRVHLNGSDGVKVRENIALLVANEHDEPISGLFVGVRDNDTFNNHTFEIVRGKINASDLSTDENEVVVSLPESVSSSQQRVSFLVYRNDRAFQGEHDFYSVNSRVLSINVNNVTKFPEGQYIKIHMMPSEEPERNQSRACAYWHFNENGTGYWSEEGCTFIRARQAGLLDTCQCDHLTHFAEILVPRSVFSEANEAALEIISIIGCIISILGLLMVGITALLFRAWRRDYSNKVWLQLCISILILSVCFLVVVYAKFHPDDIICLLTGVALHYCVLASFCWMLVAAVLSYRRLVLVFSRDASHKLLRASAFAWGAPCAVVGILLSVDPHSYAGRYEDKSPSGAFCYPSGLAQWLAVYAPIALMLLANWTLFVLIVRSVFGKSRPQNHGHGSANEAFRCASVSCLLVFLFGLPWVFGLFSFNVVAAYFFTIFVTFQGFVLFLFFVVGNKKTRDLWLNKLKIKQTRKVPVTSSTYTNRSTGANAPARGNQTPADIEAKASKPRSLSSSDNSRFS